MDHESAICRHKHLVREFIGTPPPIVTIAKDDTPRPCSPRPSLLSSDYLVVPDIYDHVGREREAAADHPAFLCPYKQFVPTGEKVGPGCVLVCCRCGVEDCHMHQPRRAAPMTCFDCGAFFLPPD